jgi:uncharacterized membrane protein YciS (DUF1049 family)
MPTVYHVKAEVGCLSLIGWLLIVSSVFAIVFTAGFSLITLILGLLLIRRKSYLQCRNCGARIEAAP